MYTNGSGNPQDDDDGLFVLDINDDGTKGANGWKKKPNDGAPGEDVIVEIKSAGNKHRMTITTTGNPRTRYKGYVSDELSSANKTVLAGGFDDNPVAEKGEKSSRFFEQDDGTWVIVKP
jgi:hypothetical protein